MTTQLTTQEIEILNLLSSPSVDDEDEDRLNNYNEICFVHLLGMGLITAHDIRAEDKDEDCESEPELVVYGLTDAGRAYVAQSAPKPEPQPAKKSKLTAADVAHLKEVAWFARNNAEIPASAYSAEANATILRLKNEFGLIEISADGAYRLSFQGAAYITALDYQNKLAERVLETVQGEMEAQFVKWGEQRHIAPVWLSILTEEVREVAKAINDKDTANLRTEIMQCAAVCASWLKYFDLMDKG